MRIFVDESDRAGGRPLYEAIIDALRAHDFPGATVLKGIEGFGPRRQIRSARTVDYSDNLPVLVEVAEDEAKIAEALPSLRRLIAGGLITLEKIDMHEVKREQ